MLISTFQQITKPYSAIESWAYDKTIGGPLCKFFAGFRDVVLPALPTGARVLDVGCGGGHIAALLASWRPDIAVTGIDLSAEQIERAKVRCASYGDRIDFAVGTALELSFDDETFDFVLSVGSIKHWPNRALGMQECMRVLKRNGRFFISDIDRSCEFDTMRNFVEALPAPKVFRPVATMLLRTYVAGRSLDVAEARDLLSMTKDVEGRVERTAIAGLIMSGSRRPSDGRTASSADHSLV